MATVGAVLNQQGTQYIQLNLAAEQVQEISNFVFMNVRFLHYLQTHGIDTEVPFLIVDKCSLLICVAHGNMFALHHIVGFLKLSNADVLLKDAQKALEVIV